MLTKTKYTKAIVLMFAILALLIPVWFILNNVLNVTNNTLSYPLDDTFIHMAIAKNMALYNNWGITKYQFSSASSSLMYTLLLSSLFKIFSVNTLMPLIVNIIAGVLLLIAVQSRLQKENISYFLQLIIILLLIFFVPLPVMIMSGMEHTLQCLFSFLLIFRFCDWIQQMINNKQIKWRLPWFIYLYGMAVCSIRYEGLFIIAILCCIMLYHRKVLLAFQFGLISVLPIIFFGIYSLTKGSYFLPNSVLLKSDPIQLSLSGIVAYLSNIFIYKISLAKNGITELATQRLLFILPLAYIIFFKYLKLAASYRYIILILSGCTLLQLCFASTGWFYRYEAYLIFCSIIIICIVCFKYGRNLLSESSKRLILAGCFVIVILFLPLILRSSAAYANSSQACINIYQQQYQMGKFLQKYYNNDTIAANDIGAVSYFTNCNIIDLWGLGNIDVAKSKRNNYNTPEFLNQLVNTQHVKLAVVYDSWFDNKLLEQWQKIATWQISNNVICGSDIVSFYVIDKANASQLRNNLQLYQKSLPADVKVVYYQNFSHE